MAQDNNTLSEPSSTSPVRLPIPVTPLFLSGLLPQHKLDAAANEVLARCPTLAPHGPPQLLEGTTGFSGAQVWRVQTAAGAVCLRAWPAGSDAGQVGLAHRLMSRARADGLLFVPRIYYSGDGLSALQHAGRIWEVQQWMPGEADFHRSPTQRRLESACTALARLHAAWERAEGSREGPCPAVLRRLAVAKQWQEAVAGGWRPLVAAAPVDSVRPIAERAWHAFPDGIPGAIEQLTRALAPRRLQACLRDPWHDHYLFEGDRLGGLIDYGAAGFDHPAVDLARTLGSLVEENESAWQIGLAAYRRVKNFSQDDEVLARLLDRTGVVLSLARWLMRLYRDEEMVVDRAKLARRLERLAARL